MRRALIFAALVLTSCGGHGSPTTPTATTPPAVLPVSLSPGPYTLTITLSTAGLPACSSNGVCASFSACSGTPDTTPARFEVQVERTGDDAKATIAGGQSLAILLHTASVPATGSISGSARDDRGATVRVNGALSGTGSSNPGVAASGNIDGQVGTDSGSCSNNGHTWTLSRN